MGLERIDSDLPESWRRLRIHTISACKLFYVRDGRNAWWGRWVTRWYVGSFHFDWEGARQYAERQRTQGSVFHIIEVPALILRVSKGYALITQLGVSTPLADYQPPTTSDQLKMRLESAPYLWRWYKAQVPVCVRGQLRQKPDKWCVRATHQLGRTMDSFCEESLFWQPVGSARVIVRLLGAASDGYPEILRPKHEMQSWGSRSDGGNYYLRWLARPQSFDASAIHKLVRSAVRAAGLQGK